MATERARSGWRPGARPRPARAVGGGRGRHGSGRTGAAGGRGGRRGTGRIRPPADERALCALSTAAGAPCIAPGCRKGVQRERCQRACRGPGGGGAGALPLGGGREMEKPAGSGRALSRSTCKNGISSSCRPTAGVMCRRPASALLLGTLRFDGRQVHMPASLEEYEPNGTKKQAEIAHNGHSIISESEQGNHAILLGTIGQKAR